MYKGHLLDLDQLLTSYSTLRMSVIVSPNAQHGLPITDFGRNAFHFTMIFGNKNKNNPTSCGLFTVSKAPDTNTFKYPCTFFIIVLEGEFDVEDQNKRGEQSILKAGDVVRIDKGAVVRWTSPNHGKGFYVAEYGEDMDPERLLV